MADLLLIDDDDDLRDALAELLERHGHTVRTGGDGRAGLRLLDERLPDLVILDVEMPALHGPGMAYQMFLHDAGREAIPILLASGVKDVHEIARFVGTPYRLAKPFEIADLFDMLAKALAERRPPAPQIEHLSTWSTHP